MGLQGCVRFIQFSLLLGVLPLAQVNSHNNLVVPLALTLSLTPLLLPLPPLFLGESNGNPSARRSSSWCRAIGIISCTLAALTLKICYMKRLRGNPLSKQCMGAAEKGEGGQLQKQKAKRMRRYRRGEEQQRARRSSCLSQRHIQAGHTLRQGQGQRQGRTGHRAEGGLR